MKGFCIGVADVSQVVPFENVFEIGICCVDEQGVAVLVFGQDAILFFIGVDDLDISFEEVFLYVLEKGDVVVHCVKFFVG